MKIKDTDERVILYGAYYEHNPEYLRQKVAYVFAQKYTKGKSVLDYGCGTGHGSYYLAQNGAKKVIGVDVSAEAVEYSKDRYKYENLDYRTTDGQKLDFGDETFDVVTFFQVIEHVKDDKMILREIKRVLKKSGVVLVTTPNKRIYSPDSEPDNQFHLREYYLDDFSGLLKSCFDKVEMYGFNESDKLKEYRNAADNSVQKRFERFLKKIGLLTLMQAVIPKRIRYFFFKRPGSPMEVTDFIPTKTDLEKCVDFLGVCTKT